MSINEWFKQRETRRYTVSSGDRGEGLPQGVWRRCPSCKRTLYEGELARSLSVCGHCGHHFDIPALERIAQLVDPGSFAETDACMTSSDPLAFALARPYPVALETARETTGLGEAIVTGTATIEGQPVVVAAFDFRFIGASMGSAVGEKVARAFELAETERRGVVMVIASGGARMQEGMLSLMQMAKTSAAAERLARAGLPYIAVLVNPAYGGVMASFASLADVIFAEPDAKIGFAGPRLVEQAVRRSLPKGFQSAASLVTNGMIDDVVPRGDLRERIATVLGYLIPSGHESEVRS